MGERVSTDWSINALKEYVDSLLREREKRRDEQQRGMLLGVRKAEEALEHRLDLLNEFREQALLDKQRFVPREEFERLEQRYEERHEELQIAVKLLQAKVAPMMWVGSTLALVTIGAFISHIVAGTP